MDFFTQAEEFENSRKFLQEHGENIELNIRTVAGFFRLAFEALKAEGFSESQAIDIIKERGPFLS